MQAEMCFYKLVFMMLFVVPLATQGQSKIKSKDSVDIKNQIEGFYSWYLVLIKEKRLYKDFNPSFVRLEDGMTTLDFRNYKGGLKRYKFTEEFIERKMNNYKACVDNLRTVPYDSFVKFELDEHEQLKCGFSNTYEWTGGMEPVDAAGLSSLERVDKKTIIANVDFTSNSQPAGKAIVTFKRLKGEWSVSNLILGR